MNTYLVFVTVDGIEYLTRVTAATRIDAECEILTFNKYFYVVDSCRAYDIYDLRHISMRFVAFVNNVLSSEPVSFDELKTIINRRHTEIVKEREEL